MILRTPEGVTSNGAARHSPHNRFYQCGLSVCFLLLFLGLTRPVAAVIFYSTGDPTHNTSAPTGGLTNSGWQYQGTWGVYLGTPIAPKYFLAASHVGGAIGDKFNFRGVDYSTTDFFDDPDSDLRIWRVCGTFPDYAQLYSSSGEVGKQVVVFGRGTQRGVEVIIQSGLTSSLKGWYWGASDTVQRWGTNVVTAIINGDTLVPTGGVVGGSIGNVLKCDFDSSGGSDEVHLSVGDSSGGVFIKKGTVWQLAGINLAVDGPYNTSTNGGGFVAAIFDEGGLYKYTAGNWVFTPDTPVDVPGSFYATRVSDHVSWINGVLQATPPPDPNPVLQSAARVIGPYQPVAGAVVDPNQKSVTVPLTSGNQFYRLQGCDLLRITSIAVNGGMVVMSYQ